MRIATLIVAHIFTSQEREWQNRVFNRWLDIASEHRVHSDRKAAYAAAQLLADKYDEAEEHWSMRQREISAQIRAEWDALIPSQRDKAMETLAGIRLCGFRESAIYHIGMLPEANDTYAADNLINVARDAWKIAGLNPLECPNRVRIERGPWTFWYLSV